MNTPEKVNNDLSSLLFDYPYSFPYADRDNNDTQLIPTFNFINNLLKSGGSSCGMSPGCTWEKFEITLKEYSELVKELLTKELHHLKEEHPYVPNKLIIDNELNEKFTNEEEWEKNVILKYRGVHEFIEFFGEYEPDLFIENKKHGTIEILGQSGGSKYFGEIKSSVNSSIKGNRVILPFRIKAINKWVDNYENFNKLKWYRPKKTLNFYVTDSWGRNTEIINIFLSHNGYICFETKFIEIKNVHNTNYS